MSTKSKIEWTEKTWNPTLGCSKVSAGCRNCYAISQVHRMSGHPNEKISKANQGLVGHNPRHGFDWTGRVRFLPERLELPLRQKKPTTYFVNSLSDLFHESITDEQLDQIFAVMALTPQHTYQVLTKRPGRMLEYLNWCERRHDSSGKPISFCRVDAVEEATATWSHCWEIEKWPLPNVWLGVSVENQKAADECIPLLLQTLAAVRFLSCEPLLEAVKIQDWLGSWVKGDSFVDSLGHSHHEAISGIDWVIVGGESGIGDRPFDIDWARSLIRQCKDAGVPVFMKQLGSKPESDGEPWIWSKGKNNNPDEWPDYLRVREFPAIKQYQP